VVVCRRVGIGERGGRKQDGDWNLYLKNRESFTDFLCSNTYGLTLYHI
jgi:hypothetical protein